MHLKYKHRHILSQSLQLIKTRLQIVHCKTDSVSAYAEQTITSAWAQKHNLYENSKCLQ